jgi:hypothetical protein
MNFVCVSVGSRKLELWWILTRAYYLIYNPVDSLRPKSFIYFESMHCAVDLCTYVKRLQISPLSSCRRHFIFLNNYVNFWTQTFLLLKWGFPKSRSKIVLAFELTSVEYLDCFEGVWVSCTSRQLQNADWWFLTWVYYFMYINALNCISVLLCKKVQISSLSSCHNHYLLIIFSRFMLILKQIVLLV